MSTSAFPHLKSCRRWGSFLLALVRSWTMIVGEGSVQGRARSLGVLPVESRTILTGFPGKPHILLVDRQLGIVWRGPSLSQRGGQEESSKLEELPRILPRRDRDGPLRRSQADGQREVCEASGGQPVRIVLDSTGRTPRNALVLERSFADDR